MTDAKKYKNIPCSVCNGETHGWFMQPSDTYMGAGFTTNFPGFFCKKCLLKFEDFRKDIGKWLY